MEIKEDMTLACKDGQEVEAHKVILVQPWVRGGQSYSKTKEGAYLGSAEEEVSQSPICIGTHIPAYTHTYYWGPYALMLSHHC